jgi:hypothetical protein
LLVRDAALRVAWHLHRRVQLNEHLDLHHTRCMMAWHWSAANVAWHLPCRVELNEHLDLQADVVSNIAMLSAKCCAAPSLHLHCTFTAVELGKHLHLQLYKCSGKCYESDAGKQ